MLNIRKLIQHRNLQMARPRVFISSTYYDLKQVRSDIERFLKEIGYDSVRNETGSIPYGREQSPEDGCYKEIENSDIVVSIIGGKFGTLSNDKEKSISQRELVKAITDEKQVFIFIEKSVEAEYQFYKKNKDKKEIFKQLTLHAVDDIKIFEHIDVIRSLDRNNAITTFESSQEIVHFLREQFAGLFQRFLQQQKKIKEVNLIDQLSNTATSLQQMVDYFSKVNTNHSETVSELILSNHPIMQKIKELLEVKYRVFFLSWSELTTLLNANGFHFESEDEEIYSNPDDDENGEYYLVGLYIKFVKYEDKRYIDLYISNELFDKNNKLKPTPIEDWDPNHYIFRHIKEYKEDDKNAYLQG